MSPRELLENRLVELAMIKKKEIEKLSNKICPNELDRYRIDLINKNMDATHDMLKHYKNIFLQ